MDQAEKTMAENLQKISGKSLEEWIGLVKQTNFSKHGEILKFLKEQHGITHGYANFIAHKALGSDAGSAENTDDLIEKQYVGKEHFQPLYEKLMNEIRQFGDDVEVAPKNAYVSLRRKRQFAILNPVTKTRFEVGINLKGQDQDGILEIITAANSMCTHKIKLESESDLTPEVLSWIRRAYDKAN